MAILPILLFYNSEKPILRRTMLAMCDTTNFVFTALASLYIEFSAPFRITERLKVSWCYLSEKEVEWKA